MESETLILMLLVYLLLLLLVYAYSLFLDEQREKEEKKAEENVAERKEATHCDVLIDEKWLQAARAVQEVRVRNAEYKRTKLLSFEQKIGAWMERRKDPDYEPALRIRKKIARRPRLPTIPEETAAGDHDSRSKIHDPCVE